MNKTIYRFLSLPGLAHEFLHYLPALWFGLNPQIAQDWSKTKYERPDNMRRVIIVLMPAFVGLLFLPFVWSMFSNKTAFHIAAAIFWVGWMGACGSDLYKAAYFFCSKNGLIERMKHDLHSKRKSFYFA
jgi:hypothetical protein